MFVGLFRSTRGHADVHSRQSNAAVGFAIGLGLATIGLVWFAYVASRENLDRVVKAEATSIDG